MFGRKRQAEQLSTWLLDGCHLQEAQDRIAELEAEVQRLGRVCQECSRAAGGQHEQTMVARKRIVELEAEVERLRQGWQHEAQMADRLVARVRAGQ